MCGLTEFKLFFLSVGIKVAILQQYLVTHGIRGGRTSGL